MCGILGQVNFDPDQTVDKDRFVKSLNMQRHRGPDDSGIYIGEGFVFGHRRLSIIDLDSHARQPMVSACRNYVLIFNGEIYNYRELRETLVKKGYQFFTSSDSEILLNAFIEYGINCIEYFIGMFAFAVFDKKKNEFIVARDRLGIKPLYYYCDSRTFIFSSEIKSILELYDRRPTLNMKAVSSYFSYRYPILDDTFFDRIFSLSPAHYIRIKNQRVEIKEYWNAADRFKEQKDDKGEEYYINELRNILDSAVRYRMISDVPFGAFLSGGVDSSIITAIMAKYSDEPIKTFTIGFQEEGFNEFDFASMVANRYHTDHREIILSGNNYIETMDELIHYKDSPLSVPNEVPLHLMSKELKKYITVVLSGEGADEIFGGYGRIFRSPYDYMRLIDLDRNGYNANEKEVYIRRIAEKYATDYFASEIDHFTRVYSYTSFDLKKSLLSSAVPVNDIDEAFTGRFKLLFDELDGDTYYNKLMYVFERIHLVGLLHRVDMTTMATSVEARVPFVDHRLVEFAFTIPYKYKLKWNNQDAVKASKLLMSSEISEKHDTPKYILKKSYEEELPYEVLYRRKMGFPVPLNNWFGGQFNGYAKKLLLSKEASSRGLYNTKKIEELLNSDILSKDHSIAMKIWMLVNLELFARKYFD